MLLPTTVFLVENRKNGMISDCKMVKSSILKTKRTV